MHDNALSSRSSHFSTSSVVPPGQGCFDVGTRTSTSGRPLDVDVRVPASADLEKLRVFTHGLKYRLPNGRPQSDERIAGPRGRLCGCPSGRHSGRPRILERTTHRSPADTRADGREDNPWDARGTAERTPRRHPSRLNTFKIKIKFKNDNPNGEIVRASKLKSSCDRNFKF